MSTPPTDDPPILGGVWLGPDPSPATPPTGSAGRWGRHLAVCGLLLAGIGGTAALATGPQQVRVVGGMAVGLALCGGFYVTGAGRREEFASSPAAPPRPLEIIDTPPTPPVDEPPV